VAHQRVEGVGRHAHVRGAHGRARAPEPAKGSDSLGPRSGLGRFEEKVRRGEARVMGQQGLAAPSLDAQFESPDDAGESAEIEARLAALKLGSSSGSPSARPSGRSTSSNRSTNAMGLPRAGAGPNRCLPVRPGRPAPFG